MTTIAYRDGVMSSDSSCIADVTAEHDVRKVYRIGGALVGAAGYFSDIFRFLIWLKRGANPDKRPKVKGEFAAIIARKDGRVMTFDSVNTAPLESLSKYTAVGAGADIALGAMFAGADARMAVRAAIKHNIHSKGPVRSYKL